MPEIAGTTTVLPDQTLADSLWQVHLAHPDKAFALDLFPDLLKYRERWVKKHFVPDAGMFWQHGMADGMETNINSRQSQRDYLPLL